MGGVIGAARTRNANVIRRPTYAYTITLVSSFPVSFYVRPAGKVNRSMRN